MRRNLSNTYTPRPGTVNARPGRPSSDGRHPTVDCAGALFRSADWLRSGRDRGQGAVPQCGSSKPAAVAALREKHYQVSPRARQRSRPVGLEPEARQTGLVRRDALYPRVFPRRHDGLGPIHHHLWPQAEVVPARRPGRRGGSQGPRTHVGRLAAERGRAAAARRGLHPDHQGPSVAHPAEEDRGLVPRLRPRRRRGRLRLAAPGVFGDGPPASSPAARQTGSAHLCRGQSAVAGSGRLSVRRTRSRGSSSR